MLNNTATDFQQQQMMMMMMMQQSSSAGSFSISKDGGIVYDLGELDQAFFQYLDGQNHSSQNSEIRPHTLNIFPSQPMHVEPSPSASKANTGSSPNPRNGGAAQKTKAVKREGNRKGPTSTSEHNAPKAPDPKTLRRLAQNREAARKSRLRKKAYVQQLESSRIRLTQLEQEIQRARSQGFYLGGTSLLPGDEGLPTNAINSDAALFDMEYARWLEDHHRFTVVLRDALQDNVPENELRVYVDNCLAHYGEVMNLKNLAAKSDVFHIFSGMWKTPAERCFMWMGGFRPSELIKIMLREIETLTEQQVLGICGMQQSTQEAEEALNQGMDLLNQSVSETLISDSLIAPPNINTYMAHMGRAINKLQTLQAFLTQADNLRHQTLHRMHQLLTTHQSASCFLAMAEYYHRLRALSGLWLARPRHQ